MSFSDDFMRTLAQARAIDVKPTKENVTRWAVMQWHVIRATPALLEFACDEASRCGVSALAGYYAQKLQDEEAHDAWLLADLERMGFAAADLEATPIHPAIAEAVGRQFYLMEFVHPSLLLGYIGLLEGFAPTSEQVDAMAKFSGVPIEAFSCAKLHAGSDVEHRKDLSAALDQVEAKYRTPILANALRSAELIATARESLFDERTVSHGS